MKILKDTVLTFSLMSVFRCVKQQHPPLQKKPKQNNKYSIIAITNSHALYIHEYEQSEKLETLDFGFK